MLEAVEMIWLSENRDWLRWLGLLSVLTVVLSIVIVPILIARMAPDYFLESRRDELRLEQQHPALRTVGIILKNLLGIVLVAGGILLSLPLVPGQGLLTIVIGLSVMNFRGKKKVELLLFRLGPVNRAVNWIRAKAQRPPLILPGKE